MSGMSCVKWIFLARRDMSLSLCLCVVLAASSASLILVEFSRVIP